MDDITDDFMMRDAKPVSNLPALRQTFMGVDASLTATGVAILTKGYIKHFVLSPPKGQDRGPSRLKWFYGQFVRLLNTYKPIEVTIEGYSFGSMNSREALGELGGMLRLAIWEYFQGKQEAMVVPPTSLKAFALSGSGSKDMVTKELFKRWGVDSSDNNESDACVLSIMGLAKTAGWEAARLTKAQIVTMDNLLSPKPKKKRSKDPSE